MESTGVNWKPVYNLLEDECTEMVVNAAHIKRVPGSKTDVSDVQWVAQLLRHGLPPSFIRGRPPVGVDRLPPTASSRSGAGEVNRIQKFLEEANIELSSVATDVLGVSGWAMLAAWAAGGRPRKRRPNWPMANSGRSGLSWNRPSGA